MAQFEGKGNRSLIINGVNIWDRFRLTSINIKGKNERVFGINRKLNYNNRVLEGVTDDKPSSILIELARVDTSNNPIPFTDMELEEIARILYKNEICVVHCDGYNYYGSFSQGELTLFGRKKKGYLGLNYDMCVAYAYTNPLVQYLRVRGEKEVEIYNMSNVDNRLYVDMEIEKLGAEDLLIENKSLPPNKIKFKGFKVGEIIKVFGEDKEVVGSITEDGFNKVEYTDFIKLIYGRNKIKITGDCNIKIIWQEPRIIK